MGLVDVCTILFLSSEEKGRRESGPITLDLTKWDFNKADCRTKCIKLIENSKPLLLTGYPIDSGGGDKDQTRAVLHLAFICELYEIQVREGRYFLHTPSHSAKSWDQPTVVDFMNRFLDMFQPVTDNGLFGVNTLTRWLTNSGCIAQALIGTGGPVVIGQTVMKAMSQQLQSDLCDVAATDQPQHRLPPPKLDILAVDADEEPLQEREGEDDVKGGPLDLHEVKAARQKEILYLWDLEVYENSTKAELRARTERNPVGLIWIGANKGSAEAPRYRSRLV